MIVHHQLPASWPRSRPCGKACTPQGEVVSVQGKRCVVMAGIARPERVREALVEAGGIVVPMPTLADPTPSHPASWISSERCLPRPMPSW